MNETQILAELPVPVVEIRRAGLKDLEKVFCLAKQFQTEIATEQGGFGEKPDIIEDISLENEYKERLSGTTKDGLEHIIFLAEDSKSDPLGFIVGHVPSPKPDRHFYALRRGRYVISEARGLGISKKLAEEFGKYAKEIGADHIEFEVEDGGMGHRYLAKNAQEIKRGVFNGHKRIRYREDL
jgi:hypothetical protein